MATTTRTRISTVPIPRIASQFDRAKLRSERRPSAADSVSVCHYVAALTIPAIPHSGIRHSEFLNTPPWNGFAADSGTTIRNVSVDSALFVAGTNSPENSDREANGHADRVRQPFFDGTVPLVSHS